MINVGKRSATYALSGEAHFAARCRAEA